eukprot:scaffold1655_cov247-Pinguiococcus_pyrenoidosus.AAC.22
MSAEPAAKRTAATRIAGCSTPVSGPAATRAPSAADAVVEATSASYACVGSVVRSQSWQQPFTLPHLTGHSRRAPTRRPRTRRRCRIRRGRRKWRKCKSEAALLAALQHFACPFRPAATFLGPWPFACHKVHVSERARVAPNVLKEGIPKAPKRGQRSGAGDRYCPFRDLSAPRMLKWPLTVSLRGHSIQKLCEKNPPRSALSALTAL